MNGDPHTCANNNGDRLVGAMHACVTPSVLVTSDVYSGIVSSRYCLSPNEPPTQYSVNLRLYRTHQTLSVRL